MRKAIWIVGTFLVMYSIATLAGFGTYRWLSPVMMWVVVFTFMPVVSAFLIYRYLQRFAFSSHTSLYESLLFTGVWMVLSFCLDAATYVLLVPHFTHSRPNLTFFRDQSPWIWLSYLVLIFSALAAQQLYRRRANA